MNRDAIQDVEPASRCLRIRRGGFRGEALSIPAWDGTDALSSASSSRHAPGRPGWIRYLTGARNPLKSTAMTSSPVRKYA